MTFIANFQQYRIQAIKLLEDEIKSKLPTDFDYQLDSYLRNKFNLPSRPNEAVPYVTWMVGEKLESSNKKRTSRSGITLIKNHEGLRTNAYLCPANVLTIGYGHTKTVYPQMMISHLQAEELLKEDLIGFEDAVNRFVKVHLNQNQFDALVSFVFNVGISAFRDSTLLFLLNKKEYYQAANQFNRWVSGGGQKLPGLVRRRHEERELFLKE